VPAQLDLEKVGDLGDDWGRDDNRVAEPPAGAVWDRASMPMSLPVPSKIFAIFEGTSEIQRMIIGRAVTGPDVR
jgi:alkylation response protein AidB-like acyl-CoA dehydrogenase